MHSTCAHIEAKLERKPATANSSRALQDQGGSPCAASLLHATPMSRRNDAYTTIYFYRYC